MRALEEIDCEFVARDDAGVIARTSRALGDVHATPAQVRGACARRGSTNESRADSFDSPVATVSSVARAVRDVVFADGALTEVVHKPVPTDHTVHLTPRTMDLRTHLLRQVADGRPGMCRRRPTYERVGLRWRGRSTPEWCVGLLPPRRVAAVARERSRSVGSTSRAAPLP